MQELTQLKTMIDTLQRRRLGFKKQIEEFKILQGEIAALQARAATDPEAQRKLKKLDAVMNTGDRVHQQMADKVTSVKKTFDQLGKQLKQLAPDQQSRPTVVTTPLHPAQVKKHRRSFV